MKYTNTINIDNNSVKAEDSKSFEVSQIRQSMFDYSPYDIIFGDPDSKVQVIQYTSPTCTHCAYYNTVIFEHIKKKYIDKIKTIWNTNHLTNYGPLHKELEEKLRLMFKEIQAPFLEVCPKSRKNFLNYSYVLHKFVELLSLDEYKVYFPLLKDREKLIEQDETWKKMCIELNWEFIATV